MEPALRISLVITEIILLLTALMLLLRRRLPFFDSLAWLLLSIFIPILGPFLTIAFLPRGGE